MSAPTSFDVVILGGGPAGVATALALAERGATAFIIEPSFYEGERVGETFPPAIRATLTRLGLWECFAATVPHVPSVGIRSVWGSLEPHDRSFIFEPYGTGWHVDRRAFDAALALAAEGRGVQLGRGHRMLACERAAGGVWTLRVTQGDHTFDVRARFVVDATGRASALVQRLGGARLSHDTLVGIFGYFEAVHGEVSVEDFTLIEAVEDGWWYSAPLPANRLVVAFMTDADLCARASLRHSPRWIERLRSAPCTSLRAAHFSLDGLHLASANSSRADPVCGQDWLAVGDAATAYDPLSGNGVYRALMAGMRAAEAIISHLSGDEAAQRQYSQELAEQFETYLQRRDAYYSLEQRWSSAPFWLRRRAH